MSGYDELLGLARLEQELVDQGRYEDLGTLAERWEEVVATLDEPTPEDRKVLEEIELTVWATVAAVRLALEETVALVAHVSRGRRAVGSYSAAPLHGAVNARG
jgi:hypothetical protein